MTLVFRTNAGQLTQTQVGTADIINVLSAARSAYGWLGGLDGAKFLLSKIPNAFSQKIRRLKLDGNLRLTPITADVLTAAGPIICSLDNTEEAFGGDVRTQVIGLTLCALAHETGGAAAVQLFKISMLEELFEGPNDIVYAIHSQLNDESHMQQILNEGAARGLTQIFKSATAGLSVAEGDRQWLRANLGSDDDLMLSTEIQMVGGLLKWIVSGDMNTYATRSALVSRVAVCLRSIGYQIGTIQTWDGTGIYPAHLNRNAVVLVLGGSSPTDRLMLDAEEIQIDSRILHYHYKTVGAMLLNALGNYSDTLPEVFQDHFEFIYQYFERTGETIYEESNNMLTPVEAKYSQASSPIQSTLLAKRLAAMYFPLSAEIVAPCYSRIATEDILARLENQDALFGGFQFIPEAVCVFRAVTAAIAISIASRFGAATFKESQHAVSLSLTSSGWLNCMCKTLDRALVSGLKYNKIVAALAVIHSAQDPEEALEANHSVVAWRCGIYSVVPSLLLSMRASPDAIAPRCIDSYWGNVNVRENGSINSAKTALFLPDEPLLEEIQGTNSSTLQFLSQPWIGGPRPGPSDIPLYLTIERPDHYSQPDLCFVGRVGGYVIGSTGVLDVLGGLLKNLDEPDHCPGHVSPLAVMNVKASQWAKNRRVKPAGDGVHTYIPIQRDDYWAIFLLGQSCWYNGRLALRCADCTVERAGSSSVIVGYC